MVSHTRREFLEKVGHGMLVAGLGAELTTELGLARLDAAETETPLSFGRLEPFVALMQETPPEKLMPQLVDRLRSGTSLKELLAAGALANARTFGGQDYVGFHTFMSLTPAYRMAKALPAAQQPLPVLKVLYRNAKRIQEFGGRKSEVLAPVQRASDQKERVDGKYLRQICRTGDIEKADRTFSSLTDAPIGEAFNHLQFAVEDEVDVHRVVLAWRGWETRELAGEQWGHCLLRQSIRYCAHTENRMIARNHPRSAIREVLPKLLDQYRLLGRTLGTKTGDDAWLHELAETIFRSRREQAADAVAQALHEGYNPESIGEAMSLAANRLVLHDPGRPEKWANAEKPAGSCHGDSVGVHACDAANAWRNIVRVSNPRNVVASIIVGAFHTAGQSGRSNPHPYPLEEQLAEIGSGDPETLIQETEAAIRNRDQYRAAALVSRLGALGCDPKRLIELMLRFATSEDGALHAEKYFSTAVEEFAATRPAYRWGQLTALARVTASEYGYKSDGYEQAKELLKV